MPVTATAAAGAVVVGTPASSPIVAQSVPAADLTALGTEGYLIRSVAGTR